MMAGSELDAGPVGSLGRLAVAWMEHFVRLPGDGQGSRPSFAGWAEFLHDCYAVSGSSLNNYRLHDGVHLPNWMAQERSRLGVGVALFEALGPARFSGQLAQGGETYRDPWRRGFEHAYEAGEPMGQLVKWPFVRCMVGGGPGETGEVFPAIVSNLEGGRLPLSGVVPGVQCGRGRVYLPGGWIRASGSSSTCYNGGRDTFALLDTFVCDSPEAAHTFRQVTRNLRSRRLLTGSWYMAEQDGPPPPWCTPGAGGWWMSRSAGPNRTG